MSAPHKSECPAATGQNAAQNNHTKHAANSIAIARDSQTAYANLYAAQGWQVLAIHPNGKRPIARGWQSATVAQVLNLFAATPSANIGIAIPAGYMVLDVDIKTDGPATLQNLEAQHGKLPDTLTATTPTGGRHVWLKLPAGVTVGNRVAIAPGLDVRADGGYVVAAPSTIDGRSYAWSNWEGFSAPKIADAPEWLTALARQPIVKVKPDSVDSSLIPEGQRNTTLFHNAAAMWREGVTQATVEVAIADINEQRCDPPLDSGEVASIVASVCKRVPPPAPWEVFTVPGVLPLGAITTTGPRYVLLTRDDLAALPPLAWRVRGVLPAVGLAGLFGPSASGKSFLGFDMAARIAQGSRWFDCRVESAPVVYAALEGEAGFKLRAQAWETHNGHTLPAGLHMVLQPFKLTDPRDVSDLAAVVPAGAVLFIDTLNRSAPTADENSSKDMGEILEASKRLQTLTAGLVVLIHHTGKDATRGLRGHSSLFAALDAAVEVSRDGDRREWRVAKSKDGQDGDAHSFKLHIEALGLDAYGEPVTSCVVVADHAARDVQAVKLPQGGNQKVVLDALRPMFRDGVTGRPGAPLLRPCIDLETAITHASGHLTCETSRRATRTRDAITGLVARGVLGCNEGLLWQTN